MMPIFFSSSSNNLYVCAEKNRHMMILFEQQFDFLKMNYARRTNIYTLILTIGKLPFIQRSVLA